MTTIMIDPEYLRALENAHLEWQRSLPKQPGQIGGTTVMLVRGTSSDLSKISYPQADPRFIEFLKTTNIPFEEVE